jgi:hypothetical protein
VYLLLVYATGTHVDFSKNSIFVVAGLLYNPFFDLGNLPFLLKTRITRIFVVESCDKFAQSILVLLLLWLRVAGQNKRVSRHGFVFLQLSEYFEN